MSHRHPFAAHGGRFVLDLARRTIRSLVPCRPRMASGGALQLAARSGPLFPPFSPRGRGGGRFGLAKPLAQNHISAGRSARTVAVVALAASPQFSQALARQGRKPSAVGKNLPPILRMASAPWGAKTFVCGFRKREPERWCAPVAGRSRSARCTQHQAIGLPIKLRSASGGCDASSFGDGVRARLTSKATLQAGAMQRNLPTSSEPGESSTW